MSTIAPRTQDRISDALILSAIIFAYLLFFAGFLVVTFLTTPLLTVPVFGVVGALGTAWLVSRLDD